MQQEKAEISRYRSVYSAIIESVCNPHCNMYDLFRTPDNPETSEEKQNQAQEEFPDCIPANSAENMVIIFRCILILQIFYIL